jgi:hypothetical protein
LEGPKQNDLLENEKQRTDFLDMKNDYGLLPITITILTATTTSHPHLGAVQKEANCRDIESVCVKEQETTEDFIHRD